MNFPNAISLATMPATEITAMEATIIILIRGNLVVVVVVAELSELQQSLPIKVPTEKLRADVPTLF